MPKLNSKLDSKLVSKWGHKLEDFSIAQFKNIEAGKQRPPKQEKSTSHEADTLLIVSECWKDCWSILLVSIKLIKTAEQ